MKDALVGMMVSMMPYMMPILWLGAGMVALGILLMVISAISGGRRAGVRLAGVIAVAVGVFFVACQIAGNLLDVPPSINFGDSRKFEFMLVPFWQLGLGLLIPGLFLRWLGKTASGKTASA